MADHKLKPDLVVVGVVETYDLHGLKLMTYIFVIYMV